MPFPTKRRSLIATIAAGVLIAAGVTAHSIMNPPVAPRTTSGDEPSPTERDETASEVVTLSDSKLAAAGMQTETLQLGSLTTSHFVPGRVDYNDNRHAEVHAPAAGILTEMLVKSGDTVAVGQVLAWLTSPEVGSARADMLKLQADAELASSLLDRAKELEENVNALADVLQQQADFDAVKQQFAGKLLGDQRSELFGAYSRVLLAESMVQNSEKLPTGVLPGKIVLERESELRSAAAGLAAACEQAGLDAWQARRLAELAASDATRRLRIAQQHLAALLMSRGAIDLNEGQIEPFELGADDGDLDHLSRVAVRAPFAGTIEQRSFSFGERVQPSLPLFTLADTRSLWITAAIRETDWNTVRLEAGQEVAVAVPALGDRQFSARIEFIGRSVSPETNAIPIVAEIDNADGLLRPGLFVRVVVPDGTRTGVLTVAAEAVQQHDGQTFVFVRESENRFRRVNVKVGETAADRTEILSGLMPDQDVVSRQAFILKSELLLEGEEE